LMAIVAFFPPYTSGKPAARHTRWLQIEDETIP
jgi:hypothetical protein